MALYELVEPQKGKDGFYDETLPLKVVFKNMTAEKINRYMMNHFGYRYSARDMETGEMYHYTTQGLKKL